jgi:hypothetical protein
VAKYQNTSNLENHYVTAGPDHKELADPLTSMQHIDRQARLGSGTDGRIALSHTFVAPAFTTDKKSLCDIKFVKWLVRNSQLCTECISCVRLHDMKTDMKCVVQAKV